MTYTQIKYGEYEEAEQSVTLRASGGDYGGGGSEVLIMKEPICIESAQANAGIMRGRCPTLNASHEQPILLGSKKQHAGVTQNGISTTLTSQEKERPIVGGGEAMNSVVRRLTPLE